MSSLLDNHQAREASRAAQGDPPRSLHQGGIQLSSWRGMLGMLYLSAREASRGSSGSAEGSAAGSAFTLEWAERRVQAPPVAAASSLEHTAGSGKQRCRDFTCSAA